MRLGILLLLLGSIFICYRKALQSKRYDFIKQRSTVEILSQEPGIVRNIGNGDLPVYVIYCEKQHLNLFPCNLPPGFQQSDKPVVVSGNVKAMQLMEHEYGQYFEITVIR